MPWNKDGTRKESAFYLKSGNTTPFKQMGASPLKQDYVGNIYDAKWNPGGTVDAEGVSIKGKGTGIKGEGVKAKSKLARGWSPKVKQYLKKLKNLPKVSGRALFGTALLAGELMYSFGKEGKKRGFKPPEGLTSGKFKTPTNKPFTFNK